MRLQVFRRISISLFGVIFCLVFFVLGASAQYHVRNLVSNASSLNPRTMDPGLVNAWGLAAFPTSPFWVSAQNSATARLYKGNGKIVPLVVQFPCVTDSSGGTTVPCPLPGEGLLFEPLNGQFNFFGPTGISANLFASFGDFPINGGSGAQPAFFIFATLDGLIVGWNPGVNATQAVIAVNRFSAGAGYTGLAIGGPPSDPHLYAANAVPGGGFDVFDSNFNFVTSIAADSNLPPPSSTALFAPYGVDIIGHTLFATYFNLVGTGGILDSCDLSTSLTSPTCKRLFASNLDGTETSPVLATPWGIVLAPSNFGPLSNKLLVGNLDDGKIHAFGPNSGTLAGTLNLADGTPFAIPGLWDMMFGSGAAIQGPTNHLFFTAGPTPDSTNPALLYGGGLLGVIAP